ncbi:MAG TPA: hypothetical protein VMK84_01670 [Streptosporangiaceae bacterium]|jgi:hypothetical protein|nr:hypothetical protein [Streptosporangiaceae bacterium]
MISTRRRIPYLELTPDARVARPSAVQSRYVLCARRDDAHSYVVCGLLIHFGLTDDGA